MKALLTLCLLALPLSLSAQLRLSAVEWQLSGPKRPKGYQPITALKRGPKQFSPGRTRVLVTIDNSSGTAVEAITLRYAVYPKVAAVDAPSGGSWELPYRLEQRRVPLIRAGAVKKVPIDTLQLEAYLEGLKASGYWPVAVRVEVMVEPKRGLALSAAAAQAELPIEWN